jgi:glycosyltransferase involved in cell wall biosynthesis
MRVAMLYTGDLSKEFRDYDAGLVPAHRLAGAALLPAIGVDVVTCHWGRLPVPLRRRQFWKIWQAMWCCFRQTRFECVIATTEAAALPALLLRRLRILRVPVVVISVAVLASKYMNGPGGFLRRAVLRGADALTTYASSQVPLICSQIGLRPERVHFLGLGVDNQFFTPVERDPQWDVVSVGTNQGKDFATLLQALTPNQRCLIVTDSNNAAVVAATDTEGNVTVRKAVPIHELRDLYASAKYCVIPLRETNYSSGQTVLLENLAMARPVIVSDVSGVRDYVSPQVATVVPPGDVDAMREALCREPPRMVPEASNHTRENCDADKFTHLLWQICLDAMQR